MGLDASPTRMQEENMLLIVFVSVQTLEHNGEEHIHTC